MIPKIDNVKDKLKALARRRAFLMETIGGDETKTFARAELSAVKASIKVLEWLQEGDSPKASPLKKYLIVAQDFTITIYTAQGAIVSSWNVSEFREDPLKCIDMVRLVLLAERDGDVEALARDGYTVGKPW